MNQITTLLQMSLSGYPFVLPDMIGGNGYGQNGLDQSQRPEMELYLRWLQANVFMPSMQFSFTPWQYEDDQVLEHVKEMVELHEDYADLITTLALNAGFNGEPINRPIWWVDADDETALSVDDGN